MKNAIIYTVLFVALQVVVSTAAQLIWTALLGNSGVMGTEFMIGTLIAFNVLGLILFLATKWAVVSRNWIRTRPWMVLFWAAMASVGCIVPSMWLQEVMPELPNLMQEGLEELMGSRLGYVVVGLLAPLVEEVVFRGAILRALLKWNQNHWLCIAISAALFGLICREADVPVQLYANRADMPGGSTLGNIANSQVSLNTIDIGLAQFAMHSAYETAGAKDTEYMIRALTLFFEKHIQAERDGSYALL